MSRTSKWVHVFVYREVRIEILNNGKACIVSKLKRYDKELNVQIHLEDEYKVKVIVYTVMNFHMEQFTWKKCKKKEGLGKRVISPQRNSVLFIKSKYILLLAVQKISLAWVGGGEPNDSAKRSISYKYLQDFTGGSTMIKILLITWVIHTSTWVLDH